MLCIVTFMVTTSSPIKLAFTLTLCSLAATLSVYSSTSNVFPCCALVISFSSGIIILFCYSRTITLYERKNKAYKSTILAIPVIILFITLERGDNLIRPIKKCLIEINCPIIVAMMGLILCCIVAINVRIVNPSKQLIRSYL